MKRISLLLAFAVLLHINAPVRAEAKTYPEVGAKAAIIMEASTGRILYGQNEHLQLPMASTTKILTALIALEAMDIDAMFKVDNSAIHVEGSSMGLQEGDSVSLRALAAGMLLASGNDGANAAAVRLSGSIPAFAARMNRRAEEIGMKNSSFETPSGLDGERHYSTAYDMALLAREALRNEEFLAICSQYRMRAAYGNPPYDRWLRNHNRLLNQYEGAIGVKTGFTRKSGRCLVSAVRRDGITLICVTLNCPSDWDTHTRLYDHYFDGLVLEDVASRIPPISVPVTGGAETAVAVRIFEAVPIPIPSDDPDIIYEIAAPRFLYAPVEAGQYIGEARIFLEGEQIALLTLTAQKDIPLLHEPSDGKGIWGWVLGLLE